MNRAKENEYIQIADTSAIEVLRRKDQAADIKARAKRLQEKYAALSALPSGHQFVYMAATVAHLCAAILAGLNIAPILFGMEVELGAGASWSDYGQTILPISMVFFLSLGIGLLISRIQLERDEIAPKSFVYKHLYLWSSLIVIVIYFALVYHIVKLGIDQAGTDASARVSFILTLSLAEIVIAVFAHKGWSILSLRYRQWRYRRQIRRNKKRMLFAQQKCDRYYQYYLQAAKPEDIYLTSNIEQVLLQELVDRQP